MSKRLVVLSILAIFVVSLAGCATARKQNDLELQGLRNQISALETQLEAKDQEINSLRGSLTQGAPAQETQGVSMVSKKHSSKKKVIGEVKSRPKIRQVQVALKNAGFEPGVIDGHMGRQTREAIKAFQSANNLSADGKVGQKTWSLLREYLYKKIK